MESDFPRGVCVEPNFTLFSFLKLKREKWFFCRIWASTIALFFFFLCFTLFGVCACTPRLRMYSQIFSSFSPNGGSIGMGAHAKYITIHHNTPCIVMYFDVFCVFQWTPHHNTATIILPPFNAVVTSWRLPVGRFAINFILKKTPPPTFSAFSGGLLRVTFSTHDCYLFFFPFCSREGIFYK